MSVLRVIDANANRAREALRVMEDAARFVLNDSALTAEAKHLRHALREVLATPPNLTAPQTPENPDESAPLTHRDTPGDVGTALNTDAEHSRKNLRDIVTAAAKRLGEALRTLEEFTKLPHAPGNPAALKQLRYRAYDLEQQLLNRLAASQRGRHWRLCLLLTCSLCTLPWEDVLNQCLAAGADCIQVREKDGTDADLLAHATDVVQRARAFSQNHPDQPAPSVIINDRPDIALASGADGVHLGQHDLPARAARSVLGPSRLVGVSTANPHQARAAEEAGADYCGVGPMFATTTTHKPDLAGPAYLRAYRESFTLPHLAIGGVTPDNIRELVDAGAQGVAVCAAVLKSENPGGVVSDLLAAWS